MLSPHANTSDMPDFLDQEVLEQVVEWVRIAGTIAMRYFNKSNPLCKSDQTLLTEADVEVERFLTEKLKAAFPDHTVIGEEEVRHCANQESSTIWMIDPVDGTTVFSQGLPGWGISVGLLHVGKPVMGIFSMPLLNDTVYASQNAGFVCNGVRLACSLSRCWEPRSFLAINATAHSDYRIEIRHTRALGGIGACLSYTARGSAVAAFVPRAYVWDLVAGAALIESVGGQVRYLSGAQVIYADLLERQLIPEPIIAGHPDVLETLSRSIVPLT